MTFVKNWKKLSTFFFVEKSQKNENCQEKKTFIANQNIHLRKSQNSAFYHRGKSMGFVENSKFFHSLFSSKKGQEKVFVADPKKNILHRQQAFIHFENLHRTKSKLLNV